MVSNAELAQVSPVIREGYAYWLAKCGGRPMPTRADIAPPEMLGFLHHVVLIDVLNDPPDFRYRLVGTLIDTHTLGPLTGRRFSELPHQRAPSLIWEKMQTVAREGKPSLSTVPYVGRNKDFLMVHDLAAPLAGPDGAVAMIIAVVDFVPRPKPASLAEYLDQREDEPD